MKRRRLRKRTNKRNFTISARKVHKKNLYRRSGRGGFAL